MLGIDGLLAVGVISEYGEAAYLSVVRLWYRWSEFVWLNLCGWLRHGPYCLCELVVFVYHVDDVFGCLVYLRRGNVLGGCKVLEEVIGGRVSLLGVWVSQLVEVY
jgi:hypothetical protein